MGANNRGEIDNSDAIILLLLSASPPNPAWKIPAPEGLDSFKDERDAFLLFNESNRGERRILRPSRIIRSAVKVNNPSFVQRKQIKKEGRKNRKKGSRRKVDILFNRNVKIFLEVMKWKAIIDPSFD